MFFWQTKYRIRFKQRMQIKKVVNWSSHHFLTRMHLQQLIASIHLYLCISAIAPAVVNKGWC